MSLDAERLARSFHETYEELAPEHGYKTREASAVPWDAVPERNRELMIATCQRIIDEVVRPRQVQAELAELREWLAKWKPDARAGLIGVSPALVDATVALVDASAVVFEDGILRTTNFRAFRAALGRFGIAETE